MSEKSKEKLPMTESVHSKYKNITASKGRVNEFNCYQLFATRTPQFTQIIRTIRVKKSKNSENSSSLVDKSSRGSNTYSTLSDPSHVHGRLISLSVHINNPKVYINYSIIIFI